MQVNQCWQEYNGWIARARVRTRRPTLVCRRFTIAPGHRSDLARDNADIGDACEPSDGINNPVISEVRGQ
jgi:hypothetical protein